MLTELRIENLLLIASVHIEFTAGLNALTGETGAGKSLLVDAMNFVLGARGDAGMVRQGAAQAEVSARFEIADLELARSLADDLGIEFEPFTGKTPLAELVISRMIPRSGRARAYANGRPIAVPALKELGERLLDIHGQHENQSLLRPRTQLDILDRFAGAGAERAEVEGRFAQALDAAGSLADLRRAARERQGREDMLRFQLKELQDARLDGLEPSAMEGEVRLLRGAEKIREAAAAVSAALDGEDDSSAATTIARAVRHFSSIGEAGPDAARIRERLEALLADARDLASEADALSQKARSDPQRLADLEERRTRLRSLERKYGREIQGLLELREKLAAELMDYQQIEIRTEQCEAALEKAVEALRHACEKLTKKRKAAARELEKRVNAELAGLGLSAARLHVALEKTAAAASDSAKPAASEFPSPPGEDGGRELLPRDINSTGAEHVSLLFSANPEIEPRPLRECASGGEISRVMLAIKGTLARVSGADRLPVVIFDEVDSGVGGRLGDVLGRKLSELSRVRQVLCVTHQPQIAAYAERQIKIEKTRDLAATTVRATHLEGEARVDELALMLRGSAASAHTRAEAAAMLREARKATELYSRKK
ncbi:MAG TPA: DNA repair protein RecN [Planctomycetota bacterium]|nr:DNA repair protein RecN [Planctomycetota bacterium]